MVKIILKITLSLSSFIGSLNFPGDVEIPQLPRPEIRLEMPRVQCDSVPAACPNKKQAASC